MDRMKIVQEIRALVDAAIEAARAEERETIESILTETLQFQSCMCLQRSLKAILARRTP